MLRQQALERKGKRWQTPGPFCSCFHFAQKQSNTRQRTKMWPWSSQKEFLALLSGEEEESDREQNTDNEAGLRAGGGGNNNGSRRGGAYRVAAGLVVEGELLDKAINEVEWLTVFWDYDRNPASRPSPPFPRWIFRLKDLRGLSLGRYPHETLPEEIGNLASLEHFHCYGSNLTRLPRSMGRLQNLVELDCYTSYNLHYLPYEISKCPNLRSSRFSTRALYNNYKNRMPLPPLQPWWKCGKKRQQANTPDFARKHLAQVTLLGNDEDTISTEKRCEKELFPPSFSDQHIIPLLCWDTCSVCEQPYEFDRALHVWSHQSIGTDAQALLAFCCSMKCASNIPKQVYFDPTTQIKNRRLTGDFPAWSGKYKHTAVKIWTKQISKSHYYNRSRCHPKYEVWTEDHLGSKNVLIDGTQLSMSSASETRNSLSPPPNGISSRRFLMKVLASGDVREQPDSSSASLGRLSIRSVVLMDGTTSNKGRKWVRLCNVSDHSERGWTALRKKDGTLKLVPLNGV